jgi:putative membrane protein
VISAIIGSVEKPDDPTRRTRLANERTYLAWWRTGLTSLAVGIGAGKIAPELADGPHWPYVVVGAAYSVLGIAFVAYGFRRLREVDRAVTRGEWQPPDNRLVALLTLVGVVLGGLTIALLVYGS